MGGGQAFHLQPRDLQTEKILAEGKNNPNIHVKVLESYLNAMFNSSRTYGLFTAYFDAELYHYAAFFYANNVFGRFRYIYSVWGIAKVLENVEISQRNYTSYQDMKRFLEQDFYQIKQDDNVRIVNKFKRYFTARVDIKLETTEGDFQIVDVSDDAVNVSKPAWFNKGGVGYVIQSYVGTLNFVAKSSVDGKISLSLRGLDVRDTEDKSKRIPYWIDYTKLTVNDKVIFDTLTPAWHDKAYRHIMDVKAGDEIKIQVEWLPHRSDV